MPGTSAGGVKAGKTNKERYGNDFYNKIGTLGGKKSRGGGFASMTREQVSEAGRKGGSASRRTAIKKVETEAKHQEKIQKAWKEQKGL